MFFQDVTKPAFDIAKTELFAKIEKAFILVYFLLYSSAILTLIMTRGASESDGSTVDYEYGGIKVLLWMLNYLITAGLFVLKWDVVKERLFSVISNNYFYWIYLMFIMLSTVWSEKPDETLKASIGMFGTVMFGVYIVCRYKLKEQINLLITFFSIVLSLSALFVLIPKYGLEHGKHAGALRGIYSHKNIFGPIVTLSCATFLIYVKANLCSNKRLAYLGFATSFAMVVAARSSSSLMYTVLLIFLIHAIEVLRLRGKLFVWSLVSLAGLYFFVTTWRQTVVNFVLNLLGKDPTLTGRTDIWGAVVQKIQERPWLGYGFDGFWHGNFGESFYVRNAMMWDLPNSHNGFLDLTLGIGLIGVAILALVLWTTFVQGLAILRTHFSWPHAWAFVYVFYLLMVNMSESSLSNQNDLQTIFMTIAITSMSLEFNSRFRSS
jgi:O-antigen ligase